MRAYLKYMENPYEFDFISSIVENNKIRGEKRSNDTGFALIFEQSLQISKKPKRNDNKRNDNKRNDNKRNDNKRKWVKL